MLLHQFMYLLQVPLPLMAVGRAGPGESIIFERITCCRVPCP